jgi:hypothetical protein
MNFDLHINPADPSDLNRIPMPAETQSPFLPGTSIQYAWSSTGLDLLKTCPRLYQYTIIDGWATRDESIHLRFGIEYHTALQDYAKSRANGVRHEDAIHDTIRALHSRVFDWVVDRESRAGKYKNRETIAQLVIDYLDHFGQSDPAETVILDDGKPAVELSFRFELDWGPQKSEGWVGGKCSKCNGHGLRPNAEGEEITCPDCGGTGDAFGHAQPYLLCGHLDAIVNLNDDLYVLDHKTSVSTISGYWFNQWTPSNQMTLYSLAGKLLLQSPVKGVIIDAAQVLLEKPHAFARGFAYRTEDQLTEWLDDLRYFFRQAEDFAVANYWPQNDTACNKFGGCKFREVCSKSPSVRNVYLRANFDKINPIESAANPFYDREQTPS